MLKPLIAAALLAASTAVFAQAPADASKAPQRMARALLGSVAYELILTAPCPVLVVRSVSGDSPQKAL